MAKKANKSSAIRDLYKQNPEIKAAEVVSTLAAQGIKVTKGLVYMVKGSQSHKRKVQKSAAKVAHASGKTDIVALLEKVNALAVEVGGFDALKKLVSILES